MPPLIHYLFHKQINDNHIKIIDLHLFSIYNEYIGGKGNET